MKEQGISKAALGLRYLIKYANHPNEAYFEVIKTCEAEIKLWSLITLFSNNMDDLWENVPVPAVDSWQSAFSGECWQEIFRECWQRFLFCFTALVLSVPC